MVWVRLDDGYPEHPKVLKAGPQAAWLNVCAWAYCARNLTDGFLPKSIIGTLSSQNRADKLTKKLLEVGLWEAVPGGYQVHDYLKYNPSRASVENRREQTAERVRQHRGNAVTGALRNGVSNAAPGPARPVRAGDVPPNPPTRTPDRAAQGAVDGPRGAPELGYDDVLQLPNGAHQCPLCPEIFTGPYADHLSESSRHKVRDEPEDFGHKRKPAAAQPDDEPAQASGIPMAKLLQEHEALLERERQAATK